MWHWRMKKWPLQWRQPHDPITTGSYDLIIISSITVCLLNEPAPIFHDLINKVATLCLRFLLIITEFKPSCMLISTSALTFMPLYRSLTNNFTFLCFYENWESKITRHFMIKDGRCPRYNEMNQYQSTFPFSFEPSVVFFLPFSNFHFLHQLSFLICILEKTVHLL